MGQFQSHKDSKDVKSSFEKEQKRIEQQRFMNQLDGWYVSCPIKERQDVISFMKTAKNIIDKTFKNYPWPEPPVGDSLEDISNQMEIQQAKALLAENKSLVYLITALILLNSSKGIRKGGIGFTTFQHGKFSGRYNYCIYTRKNNPTFHPTFQRILIVFMKLNNIFCSFQPLLFYNDLVTMSYNLEEISLVELNPPQYGEST